MTRTLIPTALNAPVSRLAECPLWSPTGVRLFWTDILGTTIHELDWESGTTRSVSAPAAVGALALSTADRLVGSLPDGIWAVDDWTRLIPLEADVPETRANDGKVDPHGRLVQGTMAWDQAPQAGGLYRIDMEGRVENLLTGLTVPNGLAWSFDGSTFYHVDSPTRLVRSYAYSEDGPLGPPKAVVEVPSNTGFPDGMTIDVDGCLWVAIWEGSAVHRYTPDGVLDTIVQVPAKRVTSCTFAGPAEDVLVVTTAQSDDGTGGGLFTVEPGTIGAPGTRFGPT